MTLSTPACDRQRIDSLVAGQLSETDEQILEQHLSMCPACCQAIQDAVADRGTWEKTGVYLRVERDEIESCSSLSSDSMIDQVLGRLSPTDDPDMLGRIGNYEVSGVVGSGGMGAVLKGFDRSLNRVIAIKVMAPHLASSGAARKRFEREAQAAAAITHENVIDIYGVSEAAGLPYLVMPYAGGMSLQKRIDTAGPMPLEEVLRIGRQIASGLAAAHQQGLVHRDIKPSNILLSEGIDRLLITDFGLARAVDDASVTRTGVIAGTPQYMSPEQARGEGIDHRSDLFSLGSVLYSCCTGRPPFRAETTFGILRRITDNEPRPIRECSPELPQWICAIISRLHAKSPAERFSSASEVAVLFEGCLAHVRQPLSNPLPEVSVVELNRDKSTSSTNRKSVTTRVLAVGFCTMVLAAAFYFSQTTTLEKKRPSALPAEIGTQSKRMELRYRVPAGQTITYLMTMSVLLPDSDVQLDGLLSVESRPTNNDNLNLWFSPELNLSETKRIANEPSPGSTYTGSETRSNRWRSSRSESVTITDHGDIVSSDNLFQLPYDAGTFAGLLFRRLPTDPDSTNIVRSDNHVAFAEFSMNAGEIDSMESDFLIGAGVPNSVRVLRTLSTTLDGIENRAPMQLEFMRLTNEERDDWLAISRQDRGTLLPDRRTTLSAQDEGRLLSDLNGERRILYWLHRVHRCSVDELSPPVIDALIALSDHSNPTFKTIVSRILDGVSTEVLNPFRTVE